MHEHRSLNVRRKKEKDAGSVVLTGRRRNDHVRIDLAGKPVWLACASFIALVDLVHARLTLDSGCTRLSRSVAHRLRKELGVAAKSLIDTAGSGEYCLTIPKAKLRRRVGITPCFYELVPRAIVSQEQANALQKGCRPCKLREIE